MKKRNRIIKFNKTSMFYIYNIKGDNNEGFNN